MGDAETVGRVHGKHDTYVVKKRSGVFSTDYYIVRESDGKTFGSYNSKASAFEAAHEKAGPESFEN